MTGFGYNVNGFGVSSAVAVEEFSIAAVNSSERWGVSSPYAASHTFSNVPIGTASSSRRVIVGASAGTGNLATCTVAGQSTTKVVSAHVAGNTSAALFITDEPITTGTTATIVVSTSSGNANHYVISCYRVQGLTSITPSDTDSGTLGGGPGGTITLEVDIPLGNSGVIGVSGAGGYNGTGFSAGYGDLSMHIATDGYASSPVVGGYWAQGFDRSGEENFEAGDQDFSVACTINDGYKQSSVLAVFP